MARTPDPDRLISRLVLPGMGDGTQSVRCIGFSKRIPTPVRRRELPSGYLTMVVGLGDPLLLMRPEGGGRRVSSFVTGLQHESAITERHGHQHGVHIELPPLAAYALFGRPISELTDKLVDLPTLLGRDARRLIDALAAARNWDDACAELRAALVRRMVSGPQPTPAVAWAWRELHSTHGAARIDQLVQRSGVSHRHLAARFREQVGMAPKEFARVLRFERSLTLLRRGGTSLAAVAAAAGYYDQAHLHRDFRAMAADSPRMYLNNWPAARSGLSKTALADRT